MKYSEYNAKRPAVFSRPADMPQARPAPAPRPKDAQAAKDRAFYVQELASEECLCGSGKLRGNSFCYRCYKALPDDMQKALYRGLGRGYEEAFEEAHKYLTENIW